MVVTTLHYKVDQSFNLSKQLGLAAVLESDLQDTTDVIGNDLLISMLGKRSLFRSIDKYFRCYRCGH